MRNVTVSMDEGLARWVRVEAARLQMSVSRFLAEVLEQRRAAGAAYRQRMGSALARKPFLDGAERRLSRDELHERHPVR
jgi:hypothetical protein